MTANPDQIGAWITAAIMGLVAAFERVRNMRASKKREENTELLSDSKAFKTRGDAMAALAEEWKNRWDKEHGEYNSYRDWVHKKGQEDQIVLSAAQLKISELQARPDFSDLFDHLKHQSDVSVQILKGIESMLEMMKRLLERDSDMRSAKA